MDLRYYLWLLRASREELLYSEFKSQIVLEFILYYGAVTLISLLLCIYYNKQVFVYQLFIEGMVFMEKKQNGEKCTGTFTKRIGNTTYRVNVHFAEDTTDTVEDKLLHLMGTVALTDEISSATDEAEAV